MIQFLSGPTSGSEGNVLQYNAQAIDQAAANDPLTYKWDVFSEGAPTPIVSQSGVGLTNFQFIPVDDGRFTIVLTVDDGDAGVTSQPWQATVDGTRVDVVTVANSPPTLLLAANQTVTEGSTFALNAMLQDAGEIDTHLATVDWGDGSPLEPAVVDEAGQRILAGHVYPQNGVYDVTLRIRDNNMPADNWVQRSFSLTVVNAAPSADAGADIEAVVGKFLL